MFEYKHPIRKESKSNIFGYVQALTRGEELDNYQLSEMLRYFAPKIPAKPKNIFDWCRQAVAKKDVRCYLNAVYVDSGIVHGCNGHIILRGVSSQYDDGYYCPKTKEKMESQGRYPDVDRIFPDRKTPIDMPNNPPLRLHMGVERVTIGEYEYDNRYYKILTNCPTDFYLSQSADGRLVLTSYPGDVSGIIMPMKKGD